MDHMVASQMNMQPPGPLSESDVRKIIEKCTFKKEASETSCEWFSRSITCIEPNYI